MLKIEIVLAGISFDTSENDKSTVSYVVLSDFEVLVRTNLVPT